MSLLRAIAPFALLALLAACGGGSTGGDGGTDAGHVADMSPEAAMGADAGDGGATHDASGAGCSVDTDCDDGTFCNGTELCVPSAPHADARGCIAGAMPCSMGQTCDETMHRCVAGSCAGAAADADGDGHRSIACGGDDCDDTDPNRYPGNHEVCDTMNHDEDCDPTTFGFRDSDGDGYPDATCCNADMTGALMCGTDCNDENPNVHPTAPEVCNGMDDNCNGMIDEGVLVTFYVDCDGDGHGELPTATPTCAMPLTMMACTAPAHYSATDDDCNDMPAPALGAVCYPGHFESCDGVDNDCNGLVDDGLPNHKYCQDMDADGYVTDTCVMGCMGPAGYDDVTATPTRDPDLHPTERDCNDMNAAINPGATDACGVDLNCDGIVGSGGTQTYYLDCDDDGHAVLGGPTMTTCTPPTLASAAALCTAPAGSCRTTIDAHWTTNVPNAATTDCDDFHATVYPAAPIVGCDDEDTDCSGGLEPVDDLDHDGSSPCACTMPDCNDSDPTTHPGATEVPGDGIDENCDMHEDCYSDADHDGERTSTTISTTDIACTMGTDALASMPSADCCDTDALAHPPLPPSFTPLPFHTTPDACGSYDYDCNGTAVDEWPGRPSPCMYNMITMACIGLRSGWDASVTTIPACGVSALLDRCDPDSCGFVGMIATQACH